MNEELKEVAEKYAKQYALSIRHIGHIGFEDGAKWQQERMYSEEEVLKMIQDCKSYLSFGDEFNEVKWFEQFKKNKMKETLEEDLLDTAIQVVGSNNVTTIREFLVKHKWQQERMYSEEEVLKLLYELHLIHNMDNDMTFMKVDKWFEQFKKK
jgi:hypothetical protein